jgi:GDP-L-fucose synthase
MRNEARASPIGIACDLIAAMPTSLYGQWNNLDPTTSHVIPAPMGKAHEAKVTGAIELVVCGYGTPRREFLQLDDAADALLHLMTRIRERRQ